MKRCPDRPSEYYLTPQCELDAQDLAGWGHVFNAGGMLANNHGQVAEEALYDRHGCPAGVTGCCGSFKPREPYSAFSGSSAQLHRKTSKLPKRKL